MQISSLSSPEIHRIDLLEHESVRNGGGGGDTTQTHQLSSSSSSSLFDMFASSQFANNAANSSSSASSLHEKAIFPEISAFPEPGATATTTAAAAVATGADGIPGGTPVGGSNDAANFSSFQFLSRSMFPERDKAEEIDDEQQGLSLQQASPSSVEIEAPGITKLWTDYDEDGSEQQQQHASFQSLDDISKNTTSSFPAANSSWGGGASRSSSVLEVTTTTTRTGGSKPKRKRSRPCKSSEEVESQRMTHIAVERNRRRQMNEHLSVLRALMPGSYVQRGDQASIIGGAIEFVKELQQLLQCLEEQKKRKMSFMEAPPRLLGSPTAIIQAVAATGFPPPPPPFTRASISPPAAPPPPPPPDVKYFDTGMYEPLREVYGEAASEVARVEVKMVGSVAYIKIMAQKQPGQLLKTMTALESKLLFTILHTNVTTIDQTVLYSFEAKVGQSCELVNDIAAFIYDTIVSSL